jgi:hypothetical protein
VRLSLSAVSKTLLLMVVCSEDLYMLLRSSLLARINDKEAPIRVQAVVALSKLCGSEDPDEVEDGEPTAIEVLTEVMSGDPSASVPLPLSFLYRSQTIIQIQGRTPRRPPQHPLNTPHTPRHPLPHTRHRRDQPQTSLLGRTRATLRIVGLEWAGYWGGPSEGFDDLSAGVGRAKWAG